MDLEQQYESIEIATIQAFLDTGREEDLYLDFIVTSDKPFDRNDKKNFAKALSGFANSSGGILVWGVSARKNSGGVDCATGKQPIAELARFISDLNSFTGEFVSPIVDGVRHKPLPAQQDVGFAVSLIPESQSGPHMAKAGEDRYYKRSGDSFYRLEHFDLEDMFGRRPRPRLEFLSTLISGGGTGTAVIVGLSNSGRGIAKFPYLAVEINAPYVISPYGLDGNGNTGLPTLVQHTSTGQTASFGGSASAVIYPGSDLNVTAIHIDKRFLPVTSEMEIPNLIIRYSMCSEGIQTQRGEHQVLGQAIRTKLFPSG